MRTKLISALCIGAAFLYFSISCNAQFPPPAGQAGSTAIFKDSVIIVGWATGCVVQRGYINLFDTSLTYDGDNKANFGTEGSALGKADEAPVSLGDGGYAILTFDHPVTNGPGYDFAVFENGLSDTFLELGFVEVSSDGVNYFRFPAVSLTQTSKQITTFGTLDATKIDNLAGKYRVDYGTPFDLALLDGTPGLDITRITHIKIIDAVGSIKPSIARYDSQGNIVNDPWPTPFNTGGFDLDAVGVLHFSYSTGDQVLYLYPNPVIDRITINLFIGSIFDIVIHDISGKMVWEKKGLPNNSTIDLTFLSSGIYFCTFTLENGTTVEKKIVRI
ncbi:MAG: T9SS type A sorting domain-containing protein [Bacteroidetes bacterium]|nr:T9SS type A sorting domain-containing protein [Bacteroidota bacterium]